MATMLRADIMLNTRRALLCMTLYSPLVFVCDSVQGQGCASWELAAESGPSERINSSMIFDEAGGTAVLFGGSRSHFSGEYGDTWEWDGAQWRLVAEEGPSPRANFAMSYDRARGVSVLFGGRVPYGDVYEDTWEWNGSQWQQVADSGPSKRFGPRMVYDSARDVTVLYGGYSGTFSRKDTWEWDGTEWTLVDDDGPGRFFNHVMVYDEARSEVLLIAAGRTWRWDGQDWQLRSEQGPAGRTHASAAFDSIRNVCVLFGGINDSLDRLSDTWEWNGEQWTRISLTGPEARSSHAMVFDPIHNEVVLFGGEAYPRRFGDTWRYVGTSGAIHQRAIFSPCPESGTGLVEWTCATSSGEVWLIFARETGNVVIPSGQCAGTVLALGPRNIQLVEKGRSDKTGQGRFDVEHGRGACGGFVQLLDLSNCVPSNVVLVQ